MHPAVTQLVNAGRACRRRSFDHCRLARSRQAYGRGGLASVDPLPEIGADRARRPPPRPQQGSRTCPSKPAFRVDWRRTAPARRFEALGYLDGLLRKGERLPEWISPLSAVPAFKSPDFVSAR
jgi:hypothetical protein